MMDTPEGWKKAILKSKKTKGTAIKRYRGTSHYWNLDFLDGSQSVGTFLNPKEGWGVLRGDDKDINPEEVTMHFSAIPQVEGCSFTPESLSPEEGGPSRAITRSPSPSSRRSFQSGDFDQILNTIKLRCPGNIYASREARCREVRYRPSRNLDEVLSSVTECDDSHPFVPAPLVPDRGVWAERSTGQLQFVSKRDLADGMEERALRECRESRRHSR